MEGYLIFAFSWIGICVIIMAIAQLNTYFVFKDIKDILKELKNHIKE